MSGGWWGPNNQKQKEWNVLQINRKECQLFSGWALLQWSKRAPLYDKDSHVSYFYFFFCFCRRRILCASTVHTAQKHLNQSFESTCHALWNTLSMQGHDLRHKVSSACHLPVIRPSSVSNLIHESNGVILTPPHLQLIHHIKGGKQQVWLLETQQCRWNFGGSSSLSWFELPQCHIDRLGFKCCSFRVICQSWFHHCYCAPPMHQYTCQLKTVRQINQSLCSVYD